MYKWQQQLLEAARSGDEKAREKLIKSYISFIKNTASNHCKKRLEWENDDELSVAMLAFNEAIDGYDYSAGKKFENYARMVIRSRLIDFYRRESKHQHLSLSFEKEGSGEREDSTKLNSNGLSHLEAKASFEKYKEKEAVEDRREEMEEFEKVLGEYGISLELLEDSAPRHKKTRDKLVEIAKYIADRQDLVSYVARKKKLPLKELVMAFGVNKKVVKRGRKYILGILLIIIDERFSYLRSLFSLPGAHEMGEVNKDEKNYHNSSNNSSHNNVYNSGMLKDGDSGDKNGIVDESKGTASKGDGEGE